MPDYRRALIAELATARGWAALPLVQTRIRSLETTQEECRQWLVLLRNITDDLETKTSRQVHAKR